MRPCCPPFYYHNHSHFHQAQCRLHLWQQHILPLCSTRTIPHRHRPTSSLHCAATPLAHNDKVSARVTAVGPPVRFLHPPSPSLSIATFSYLHTRCEKPVLELCEHCTPLPATTNLALPLSLHHGRCGLPLPFSLALPLCLPSLPVQAAQHVRHWQKVSTTAL